VLGYIGYGLTYTMKKYKTEKYLISNIRLNTFGSIEIYTSRSYGITYSSFENIKYTTTYHRISRNRFTLSTLEEYLLTYEKI